MESQKQYADRGRVFVSKQRPPSRCPCDHRTFQQICVGPIVLHVVLIWHPIDYHPFLHVKKHTGGKRFDDDYEVKEEVNDLLKEQTGIPSTRQAY